MGWLRMGCVVGGVYKVLVKVVNGGGKWGL